MRTGDTLGQQIHTLRDGTRVLLRQCAPADGLPTGTLVAYACWLTAGIGFTAAAVLFRFGLPSESPAAELWRFVALAAAFASLAGLLTFFGTWPWFNTVAALSVNVVVVVTQLVLRSPTTRALGNWR